MKILAMIQGAYGQRITAHLKTHLPTGWSIEAINIPRILPPLIDEPEEFLPAKVTEAELLLAKGESEGAAQLIPALAKLCRAKAVISPVDNPEWLPTGLKNQIKQELENAGINAVFPKTFCTLTENSAGFRRHAEPYNDELIKSFARYFGCPRLKLTINPAHTISSVKVERESPCGSTRHAAERLVGMLVDEAKIQAGLLVHQFPCLATMQTDEIDEGLFEPVMHISGYIINDEIEREIDLTGV